MHDRNGKPLAVGDKVNIPCTVVECGDGNSQYCNLSVVTDVPMADRTEGDRYTLNAHQVEKVEACPTPGPCVPPPAAAGMLLLALTLGTLAITVGCSPSAEASQDFRSLAAASIAVEQASNAPAPVTPKGKCTNCNGSGYVGDGTVRVKCTVCDGKGFTAGESVASEKEADPSIVEVALGRGDWCNCVPGRDCFCRRDVVPQSNAPPAKQLAQSPACGPIGCVPPPRQPANKPTYTTTGNCAGGSCSTGTRTYSSGRSYSRGGILGGIFRRR